jgi:hypothetical protein
MKGKDSEMMQKHGQYKKTEAYTYWHKKMYEHFSA